MIVPSLDTIWVLVSGSISGIIAYTALAIAMRTGEIAAVTLFRYTRLVFAVIAGFFVFQELPDSWTIAGSAVIVGSGIFALTERKRV